MPQHLHIISLNVPYPADYGGMFDIFYKLPALHSLGIHIHLHCFAYGRPPQKELERYCHSVHYYPRQKTVSFTLPYIVASRHSKALFMNLLKDDYPILMEGIHCSYPLFDKRFAGRALWLRLHNTEYVYYRHLFAHTSRPFHKLYYLAESLLLKRYEKRVAKKALVIWAMSGTDVELYRRMFHNTSITYLPLFIPPWQVSGREGYGTFCLYQGNLSVEENEQAVLWLIKHVFASLSIPFMIAGKNPSRRLAKAVQSHSHIGLRANPSTGEMDALISEAHIHILPSFNATGIKIKLVHALFNGRHCIANTAAVAGTTLHGLCHIADAATDMQAAITRLFQTPFNAADIQQRQQLLTKEFDNKRDAQLIHQQLQLNQKG